MKNTAIIKVLLLLASICLVILIVLGISLKNHSNAIVETSLTGEDKDTNDDATFSNSPTSNKDNLSFENIIVRDVEPTPTLTNVAEAPPEQTNTLAEQSTPINTNQDTTDNSSSKTIAMNTPAIPTNTVSEETNSSNENVPSANPDTPKTDDAFENINTDYVSSNDSVANQPSITPIPEPTATPTPEEIFPYYIKINRTQNVVNVYARDEQGEYTIPYKVLLCSTGTYTPATGKIVKLSKDRYRWGLLNGNVYGQYATRITGSILFHSVPYTAQRNNALEYWEYDKLRLQSLTGVYPSNDD